MRTVLSMAAVAVLCSAAFATPAQAQGGGALACNLYYDSPTGVTNGIGYCTVTGAAGGVALASPVMLRFIAVNSCPSQIADGSMSGSWNGSFAWTRIGVTVVMTTTGDVDGAAYGLASSPCPMSGELVVFGFGGV